MKTLESFFNRPHYLTPQNKRLDASAFSHRLRSKKRCWQLPQEPCYARDISNWYIMISSVSRFNVTHTHVCQMSTQYTNVGIRHANHSPNVSSKSGRKNIFHRPIQIRDLDNSRTDRSITTKVDIESWTNLILISCLKFQLRVQKINCLLCSNIGI